ncbi:MAG: DUF882 domain-containing protein [Proteobacteria bacterium]|nr:DUF882 domain-containing protein [Pseudomonadota bacterium]
MTYFQKDRRHFLKKIGQTTFLSLAAPSLILPKFISLLGDDLGDSLTLIDKRLQTIKTPQALQLSFYSRHTGETLKRCTFWESGNYIKENLIAINKLMRDHRTNQIHPIDPKLIYMLYQLQEKLNTKETIHVISAYRSLSTNKMLCEQSSGVARNSQHVKGKAVDLVIPGRSLEHIQRAAKSLRGGGVGRYAHFVHVDTGRVRYW